MTVPKISVRNLQRQIPLDIRKLQIFATKAVCCCLALRKRKQTESSELEEIFVWLISDRRMSQLHRRFLGGEGPTDVLTFQHGEIFVSVETAKQNARIFTTSLMRELQLYIVHGLLHLNGFDDQTPADARKMRRTQERILRTAV